MSTLTRRPTLGNTRLPTGVACRPRNLGSQCWEAPQHVVTLAPLLVCLCLLCTNHRIGGRAAALCRSCTETVHPLIVPYSSVRTPYTLPIPQAVSGGGQRCGGAPDDAGRRAPSRHGAGIWASCAWRHGTCVPKPTRRKPAGKKAHGRKTKGVRGGDAAPTASATSAPVPSPAAAQGGGSGSRGGGLPEGEQGGGARSRKGGGRLHFVMKALSHDQS